ncbi:hypothetical protein EVAR_25819_1 [Eumeta japonica]|uniref:Integrase catalytic domain-containing protein n=1 Tax=Eumeta variegata TaxID=151549 RepID=A0A4C1VU11_EUMVA|nr:hypothetical protein EVAR_25819_1 [Eumeta japonica]
MTSVAKNYLLARFRRKYRWQWLHADFAQYRGKHYLVVVDVHTKWIEVSTMAVLTRKVLLVNFESGLNCEHATTGVSPAMAMFGRRLRGRLDTLRPNTALRVVAAHGKQQARAADTPRGACPGDTVSARDYSIAQPKWVEGRVRETVGPVSYNAELPSRVMSEKSEKFRDRRTRDINETRDAFASSGVQSERMDARESCEVHSRIPAPAVEALVEAKVPKEAT